MSLGLQKQCCISARECITPQKLYFWDIIFLIIRTVVHSANTQYNLLYVLSKIFFHFFFNFLAERNQFYTKGPWTFRLFLSTGFCKDKCYRSYFVVVTFLTEIQNQLEIHHLFKIWMVIFTTVQEFWKKWMVKTTTVQ